LIRLAAGQRLRSCGNFLSFPRSGVCHDAKLWEKFELMGFAALYPSYGAPNFRNARVYSPPDR